MPPPPANGDAHHARFHVDLIIEKLLGVRELHGMRAVLLAEQDVRALIITARDVLMSQEPLLDLMAPLKVCGDIHGQFYDLLRVFELGGFPPDANYLFLGDYVDRGKYSLETICLLLAYKVKYPENFFLLRGNHESAQINKIYGFYDDCKRRQNVNIWKMFTDLFNCMPVAALIDERILCMHGGLSPELKYLDQIRGMRRPMEIPDEGVICDLLWADPREHLVGWEESDRNISYHFGENVVGSFLETHELDLIVRAHQVVEDGYEFFAHRQLVTLFSAPQYCGEFDNSAGIMTIDDSLVCSFQILKAQLHQHGGKDAKRLAYDMAW